MDVEFGEEEFELESFRDDHTYSIGELLFDNLEEDDYTQNSARLSNTLDLLSDDTPYWTKIREKLPQPKLIVPATFVSSPQWYSIDTSAHVLSVLDSNFDCILTSAERQSYTRMCVGDPVFVQSICWTDTLKKQTKEFDIDAYEAFVRGVAVDQECQCTTNDAFVKTSPTVKVITVEPTRVKLKGGITVDKIDPLDSDVWLFDSKQDVLSKAHLEDVAISSKQYGIQDVFRKIYPRNDRELWTSTGSVLHEWQSDYAVRRLEKAQIPAKIRQYSLVQKTDNFVRWLEILRLVKKMPKKAVQKKPLNDLWSLPDVNEQDLQLKDGKFIHNRYDYSWLHPLLHSSAPVIEVLRGHQTHDHVLAFAHNMGDGYYPIVKRYVGAILVDDDELYADQQQYVASDSEESEEESFFNTDTQFSLFARQVISTVLSGVRDILPGISVFLNLAFLTKAFWPYVQLHVEKSNDIIKELQTNNALSRMIDVEMNKLSRLINRAFVAFLAAIVTIACQPLSPTELAEVFPKWLQNGPIGAWLCKQISSDPYDKLCDQCQFFVKQLMRDKQWKLREMAVEANVHIENVTHPVQVVRVAVDFVTANVRGKTSVTTAIHTLDCISVHKHYTTTESKTVRAIVQENTTQVELTKLGVRNITINPNEAKTVLRDHVANIQNLKLPANAKHRFVELINTDDGYKKCKSAIDGLTQQLVSTKSYAAMQACIIAKHASESTDSWKHGVMVLLQGVLRAFDASPMDMQASLKRQFYTQMVSTPTYTTVESGDIDTFVASTTFEI